MQRYIYKRLHLSKIVLLYEIIVLFQQFITMIIATYRLNST